LRDNDIRLAELARGISAAQWSQPSLCTEWTNHEVLAHLVIGYQVALSAVAAGIQRSRGSFNTANTQLARRLAAQRTPDQLIVDFAALVHRPQGIGRVFPKRLLLGDHVIHELDVTYALNKRSSVPVPTVVAVLDTQVRVPNPLLATDAHWSHHADGPTIAGQAAHLASVLAGRPWALRHLSGDGVAVLSSRV
jgi:uncharacterized protein (TIGR03083 family)